MLDYSGLYLDPMIFQQYIEPAYELRVTVVGKKIFTARVSGKDIDGQSGFRDWRYAHINETFKAEVATLDQATKEACIRLTQKFGLNFGAIDLIVDKKGKVWFLEINPNGQWGFIENETGLPIGKALAELLTSKRLHNSRMA